jgi:hypothetical protein
VGATEESDVVAVDLVDDVFMTSKEVTERASL